MRIVFLGTPTFSIPSLESLLQAGHQVAGVYTRPDRPRGRGLRVQPLAVKRFSQDAGLPVFQPSSLKDPEVLAGLGSMDPDILVVVAFGRILPESWLCLPPRGAVNLHASLLPRHRGAAPVAWSILQGDRQTGVTTMRMDAGMDTGDILLQKSLEISPRETAGELSGRLAVIGAELLVETLNRLDRRDLKEIPQDPTRATMAPRIGPEDARIEWSGKADRIARRIRAFQPRPGAFTRLNGRRLKICRGFPIADRQAAADTGPGQVLSIGPEGASIACGGRTVLRVEEIQPEGRAPMSPEAFARGRQIHAGDRFGND